MMKAIYFDMDGTIADLYGVENWLESLDNERVTPYLEAKALVDMYKLGKILNTLQKSGYHIGIISWSSKGATPEYDGRIEIAKKEWLDKNLHSVDWDEIKVVPYGTPKETSVKNPLGILFDDEKRNRDHWLGEAYDVQNILEVLSALI